MKQRRCQAAVPPLLGLLVICLLAAAATAQNDGSIAELNNATARAPHSTNAHDAAVDGKPLHVSDMDEAMYERIAAARFNDVEQRGVQDAMGWLRRHSPRNASPNKKTAKFKVCVSPAMPYTICDVNDPHSQFGGFEVELFRHIAPLVPWLGTEGVGWQFSCGELTPQNAGIEEPNGVCLILMRGMVADDKHLTDSTVSYMDKGYAILMLAHRNHRDKLFSPFLAFSWQLWVALLTTALVVSGILWALDTSVRAMDHVGVAEPLTLDSLLEGSWTAQRLRERSTIDLEQSLGQDAAERAKSDGGAAKRADSGTSAQTSASHRDKIVHLLHRAHGDNVVKALVNLDETLRVMMLNLTRVAPTPSTSTLPSQLVLWAWGLLTLITISMFTAATAAALTTNALSTGVQSLADLHGQPVIVYDDYLHRFSNSGANLIPYPWRNLADEQAMIDALRAHKARAILMDSNWVKHQAGTQCDLMMAGEPWTERFVGMRWHINATDSMIDGIDILIKAAKRQGVITELRDRLVLAPSTSCSRKAALAKTTTVELGQVAGLWIILAIAVTAAVLAAAILFCTRHVRRAQRERLARTLAARAATVRRSGGL